MINARSNGFLMNMVLTNGTLTFNLTSTIIFTNWSGGIHTMGGKRGSGIHNTPATFYKVIANRFEPLLAPVNNLITSIALLAHSSK